MGPLQPKASRHLDKKCHGAQGPGPDPAGQKGAQRTPVVKEALVHLPVEAPDHSLVLAENRPRPTPTRKATKLEQQI